MTAPGAGRGATEAEIVVAEVHLPGLEMAEWVIREMAGRHGHASAIDAAGLLMRLRGAIWPAHRAAGSVYPTPFDPLVARPSPRDGGAAGEGERLTRERDDWQTRAWECLDAETGALARAEAAERRLGEAVAANARLRLGKDRFRAGVRVAITWMHAYGRTMNDTHAKAVLDCAADRLGSAVAWQDKHPTGAATVSSPVGLLRIAAQFGAAAREGEAFGPLKTKAPENQASPSGSLIFNDLALIEQAAEDQAKLSATKGITPSAEDGHGH